MHKRTRLDARDVSTPILLAVLPSIVAACIGCFREASHAHWLAVRSLRFQPGQPVRLLAERRQCLQWLAQPWLRPLLSWDANQRLPSLEVAEAQQRRCGD